MEIYQLYIELMEIEPKIWRRILIPNDFSVADFHKIIQTTMGWENAHLHQFIKDKINYSTRMHDDDDKWDEMGSEDYANLKVGDLLVKINDKILYEYDFGDSWMHSIVLEKKVPEDRNSQYPICIDGARDCPPEDCGGVQGYFHILEIMKKPGTKKYVEMQEWLEFEFEPEYFNSEEINAYLQEEDFGCFGDEDDDDIES
jgi:hypothetical protein